MKDINTLLLSAENTTEELIIDITYDGAFSRILGLLQQHRLILQQVAYIRGGMLNGLPVNQFKGKTILNGFAVEVLITTGEDGKGMFAIMEADLTSAGLQVLNFFFSIDEKNLKGTETLLFPRLQLYAEAQSGSNQEFLEISGFFKGRWNPLGIEGLGIEDLKLGAVISTDKELLCNRYSAVMAASFLIKDKVVPIEVMIPIGPGIWRIRVPKKTTLPSLADLVSMIGGEDAVNALPEQLRTMPSLLIRTLDLRFDPQAARMHLLNIDIASSSPWQFNSRLSLENLRLQLSMAWNSSKDAFPYTITGRISGRAKLGKFYLAASIPYPLNGTTILETSTAEPLPSLGELFLALDLPDLVQAMPQGIAASGAMNIHHIRASLNLAEKQLQELDISVSAAGRWPLLPGKFEIAALYLDFNITPINESWGICGRIGGTVALFNTTIAIEAGRYAPGANWYLRLTQPLLLPDIGELATLTGIETVTDTLFPAGSGLRQLQASIDTFDISLHHDTGRLAAYAFGISMKSPLVVLENLLVLNSIDISLEVISPFDNNTRAVNGTAACTLTFAGMTATLEGTLDQGLVLQGTIPEMRLVTILESLTGTVPPELPDVVCRDIYFSLDTRTQAFVIRAAATADWDYAGNGAPLHATFQLDLERNAAAELSCTVKAAVKGQVAFNADCYLQELDLSFYIQADKTWGVEGNLQANLYGYTMHLGAGYHHNTLLLSWSAEQEGGKQYLPLLGTKESGILGCSAFSFTIGRAVAEKPLTFDIRAKGVLEIPEHFSLTGELIFRKDAAGTYTAGFHANMDNTAPTDTTADIMLDIVIPQDRSLAKLSGALREVELKKLAALFLRNTPLPETLPQITFSNLAFEVMPVAGTFSFSGEATAIWQLNKSSQSLHTSAQLEVGRRKTEDAKLLFGGALKFDTTTSVDIIDSCSFRSFHLDMALGQQQTPVVKGSAAISLFDHELDFSVAYIEHSLQLTADLHSLQLLNIEAVMAIQLNTLAFVYAKTANNVASWEMAATADISLEHIGHISGTLQLFNSPHRSGLSFKASNASLEVPLPVPGVEMALLFGFDHFSLYRETEEGKHYWGMEAALDLGIKGLPEECCRYFGEQDRITFKTTLQLRKNAFHLHLDRLIGPVMIPIPDIEQDGKTVSLGAAQILITDLDLSIGRTFGLSVTGGLRIPAELDRIFGQPSSPFFNAFDPARPDETTVKLEVGIQGSSVHARLLTSPLAAVQMKDGWVKLDLGDFGKFRFTLPQFSLKGNAFAASIKMEREGELAIPVSLLKKLLKDKLQMEKVANLLPDKIPISDIRFFDENRHLQIGPFLTALAPDKATEDLLRSAIDAINKTVEYLPDRLVNNYMKFTLPESFYAEISIGTGCNVNISVGVGESSEPIRALYPTMTGILPALGGIELRSFSFGTLFGASIFNLSLDATFDQFDIISLGAAALAGWMPESVRQLLPDTTKFQQTLTISELYMIIIVQGYIVVPLPLFYKHIGIDHYGLEGLHLHGHIRFPKPELDVAEIFTVLNNLRRFFTDPAFELPETDDKLPQGFDLVFTFENSYLLLPTYLGGAMVGKKEGELVKVKAAKIIAKVLNTVKFFSLRKLIESIPIEYRIVSIQAQEQRLLDFRFRMGYALTTPGEFIANKQLLQSLQLTDDSIDHFFSYPLPPDANGMMFLAKGKLQLFDTLELDARLGIAARADGFLINMRFYGAISDLLQITLAGEIKADKRDHHNPVALSGQVLLRSSIFENHEILRAVFDYRHIDGRNYCCFSGLIRLFPANMPIALEAEASIDGRWSDDAFSISNAETRLTLPVLGSFRAVTTLLITREQQLYYTVLHFNDKQVRLLISNNNNEFQLHGEFDALCIGRLLRFTSSAASLDDTRPQGPEIYILTDKAAGQLKLFYLDGKITFLGMYAAVRVNIRPDYWEFMLAAGIDIKHLLEAEFRLNCRMAPDLAWLNADASFKVGLQFEIPKISFWVWFFGWHEIVLFDGIKWSGSFDALLDIKVYNPATWKSTFDYDAELQDIAGKIARITREIADKEAALQAKRNGLSNERNALKDQLRTRAEKVKRVQELQHDLINLYILDQLFEAKSKRGSDPDWTYAYNNAVEAYRKVTDEYLRLLDELGFATSGQLKFYMEALRYLDKIIEYIVVYSFGRWGYGWYNINEVLSSRNAPEYDIVLQFVLMADNIKRGHLAKHGIAYTTDKEDEQIVALQQRITDMGLLSKLFDARSKKGSDPEWKTDYDMARNGLFERINAYTTHLEQVGWESEQQRTLMISRLNYIDKIKEYVIVFGHLKWGYNGTYVQEALRSGNIPDYDIILKVLAEIEALKIAALNKCNKDQPFDSKAIEGTMLPNAFGLSRDYHQQETTYEELNTAEGVYRYLQEEILSYQVALRQLRERELAVGRRRKEVEDGRNQPIRFELKLRSSLRIQEHVLVVPPVEIMVAPNRLQDILGEVSAKVLEAIMNSLWNVVVDLFSGPQRMRAIGVEDMSGADSVMEGPVGEKPFPFSFIRHPTNQEVHRRLLMAGSDMQQEPPPKGYDAAFDLTEYL
ncbi:hypothetical protein [Chitinophaga flava]|uniref:Uncharacterized protein n=1 Tax=Chitinophaga flava TaxID=2259036 RepID=A0A365XTC6_9BACT|nr:hypothetical protein [Chitinophaga flava]RBL89626.1 hypothetical protein DF182_24295 [Chitinophaga flava]